MREEPKSLAEWLESQGNPKHSIAEGENGSMVIAVENRDSLSDGITLYNFTEKELPGGFKHFWMSSGWGVRKEYFPALKKFLNEEEDDSSEPEFMSIQVWEWFADEKEDTEYDRCIDVIRAVSEYHAKALLKDGINRGKYPKGAWLEYELDGKTIKLDAQGRIPA